MTRIPDDHDSIHHRPRQIDLHTHQHRFLESMIDQNIAHFISSDHFMVGSIFDFTNTSDEFVSTNRNKHTRKHNWIRWTPRDPEAFPVLLSNRFAEL